MQKRIKVYPAPPPLLDEAKAPWSAPRGYSTSIPEAVETYKLSVSQSKVTTPPPIPSKTKSHRTKDRPRLTHLSKCWTSIKDHFRGIKQDILPQQTQNDPDADIKMPRLLACLCCLPKI